MVGFDQLRASKLKQLALKCGVPQNGTKADVICRLNEAIQKRTQLKPTVRILSIDLGLQNLAFSLLTPSGKRRGRTRAADAGPKPLVVDIHAWQRFQVTKRLPTLDPGGGKYGEDLKDWSPSAMSQVAVHLVANDFLPLRPTHVLIERQRFRSGGSSAIFEWTLRVNTLEAMLYATFETLKASGRWEGATIPVNPKLVGKYLSMDESGAAKDSEEQLPTDDKNPKHQKIDLLGDWLISNEHVKLASEETNKMKLRYLHRWSKNQRGNGKARVRGLPTEIQTKIQEAASSIAEEGLKKLDDLADSLMQGVSWLQWQNHLEYLGAGGDPETLFLRENEDSDRHAR